MKKIVTSLALVFMAVSAQASPLNEGAAKDELTRVFNEHGACFIMRDRNKKDEFEFPYPVETTRSLYNDRSPTIKLLKAFVENGFVTVEKKKTKMKVDMGMMGMRERTLTANVYDLTDLGKKYYKSVVRQFNRKGQAWEKGPGFCYGDIKLVGLKSVSERGHVRYEYTIDNISDWANSEAVLMSGKLMLPVNRMTMKVSDKPVIGSATLTNSNGAAWTYDIDM